MSTAAQSSTTPSPSILKADYLTSLGEQAVSQYLASLTNEEKAYLAYYWPFWARQNQLPPAGDWRVWLVLAGRGFGKTRTGAEWCKDQIESQACGRLALVAATAADARDVMVEGESGILAISPPWNRPRYEPSKRRLSWKNGAIATLFSADEPNRLRGPQHDGAWCDELAVWRYPDAWDQLMFGLRLGRDPRVIVTTTPKPTKLLKTIMAEQTTVVTGGSTYENVNNLAAPFREYILRTYEGTRLGQQELHAKLLEDTPGALWTRSLLEQTRVTKAPDLDRIVVGVDPSTTTGGDEAGIVVAGIGDCMCKGTIEKHGFVLDDRSAQGSPKTWATAAVSAYNIHEADLLVAESNQGGEMVSTTIGTIPHAPPVTLIHASRSKHTRAEPVSSLYEQFKVHHVGMFGALEDEYCSWVPGEDSPNRLDAAVWALTELMLGHVPIIVEF